ncbi:TetR family transcriptional regulator [Streptomyces hirsutus]|uniref:TetR family transcriptional regulator n=1 Tax=Streptomyces hirsutus TaxID=35620 RepID=UPI0034238419
MPLRHLTEAIAKRVGVTQPHLFRLFPDKQAISVSALTRSAEDTRLLPSRQPHGRRTASRPSTPWQTPTRARSQRTPKCY